jgi:NTP pyrophosphatase (non-canonical NTP hydrolase)
MDPMTVPEKLLRQAIDKWGFEAQLDKLEEEMVELYDAIQHYRGSRSRQTENQFIHELIDVHIMVQQFFSFYRDDPVFTAKFKERIEHLERILED